MAKKMAKCIFSSCRYTPDVVFLQELIPPYVEYLKKRAVSYLIIEGIISWTFALISVLTRK